MFIILVYDIGEKRVGKILKIVRKYLYRVQNSVFEGEISDANYRMLLLELLKKINKNEDSIICYKFRTNNYIEKEIHGIDINSQDIIL